MSRLPTQLIHSGEPEPRYGGAVVLPVFQSANFEDTGSTEYSSIRYARLNNTPNHLALHEKLRAIEGGEAALVTSSGMAAISSVMFGLLREGDHILMQKALYGGTHSLVVEDLKRFGVTSDFVASDRPETWKSKLTARTKMFYVESISNPLMEVPDLEAVVKFARENDLYSVIDNTFATPVNFRPLELGFQISLHSATKYLNGHSDIVAGAIVGQGELLAKINHTATHLGGSLDPHACFLLHRGMKTLYVRVKHQNQSALQIARALADHPRVESVNYPGLESSASHARARKYFSGFGGMISFELKDSDAAGFIARTRLALHAASLGGVESLLIQPARSSHLGLGPEGRAAAGITDSLIRLSVGLEDPSDLIEDLNRALV